MHGGKTSNTLQYHWSSGDLSSTCRTLISLPPSLAPSLLMTFLGLREGKHWITKPRVQLITPLPILLPVEGTFYHYTTKSRKDHMLFKSLVWSSLRLTPNPLWGEPEQSPHVHCVFVCLDRQLTINFKWVPFEDYCMFMCSSAKSNQVECICSIHGKLQISLVEIQQWVEGRWADIPPHWKTTKPSSYRNVLPGSKLATRA